MSLRWTMTASPIAISSPFNVYMATGSPFTMKKKSLAKEILRDTAEVIDALYPIGLKDWVTDEELGLEKG